MPRRWSVALATFSFAALTPAVAAASPTFPAAIQEHLGLACEPDCTNCHTRPEGGLGTARQPFGLAMQGAGLRAGQPGKIAAALDTLEEEQSDVDGDGVPDIQELRDGQSPDAADTALACYDAPGEDDGGCTVQRTGHTDGAALLASAAVAAVLLRRRILSRVR